MNARPPFPAQVGAGGNALRAVDGATGSSISSASPDLAGRGAGGCRKVSGRTGTGPVAGAKWPGSACRRRRLRRIPTARGRNRFYLAVRLRSPRVRPMTNRRNAPEGEE